MQADQICVRGLALQSFEVIKNVWSRAMMPAQFARLGPSPSMLIQLAIEHICASMDHRIRTYHGIGHDACILVIFGMKA